MLHMINHQIYTFRSKVNFSITLNKKKSLMLLKSNIMKSFNLGYFHSYLPVIEVKSEYKMAVGNLP